MYDLVIKNASIIDGTGRDAYVSDIAIKDGKIARISESITDSDKVLDVTGLTVTPGWIDSHSHSDRTIFKSPDQKEKVEQGIVFSVTSNCGLSEAPVMNGQTMGEFLEKAYAVPQGSSSSVFVGHNTLRAAVMGKENRQATPEEMEQMKALLREGLEAGALGMSFGLYYVPGCYAKIEECIELAKVVAEYDKVLSAHIRNEADDLIESVEEYLTIIKKSGCRAVFSHHKAAQRQNWGKVKITLEMIDKANRDGADIYLDVYPYTASATSVIARFVPKMFHPEGTTNAVSLLDDEAKCKEIKDHWMKIWGDDLSWVLITSCGNHSEYAGKNVNEIADMRGQTDRYETVFDIIRMSNGSAQACFFMMCDEDAEYVIKHPRAMICTDSSVACGSTVFHPRLRAAFPRAIAKYVREFNTVTLPEMIRRMTSLAAHVYHLDTKGIVAEGYDADLCIFNAETIADKADYVNCTLNNEGLEYVLIDGRIVLENGNYNGIRAGKVYKF